jgi:hypothetical protein
LNILIPEIIYSKIYYEVLYIILEYLKLGLFRLSKFIINMLRNDDKVDEKKRELIID